MKINLLLQKEPSEPIISMTVSLCTFQILHCLGLLINSPFAHGGRFFDPAVRYVRITSVLYSA